MDADTAAAPAAAPAYTSDIFKTWRVFGPMSVEGRREPAGWVATDAVRTFGITDGDDAWVENPDLIGYHFGAIDDGTTAVPTPLPDGLPPLPIGPNADPNARLATTDPDPTDGFAATVGMFVDRGRAKLAEARTAPTAAVPGTGNPPAAPAPGGPTVAP